MDASPAVTLRDTVEPGDLEAVRRVTAGTGFFNDEEVDIAVELVTDRFERGAESGYRFLLADRDGELAGYTCYGRISGTRSSWDLYWIVVRGDCQRGGLGRMLMAETEERIARAGGGRVYAETSSRDQYLPTRSFYERCGYRAEAVIEEFYAPGDSKVIFVKSVGLK
jgi:ribosomal protein S18 acetylase RimI-like enzyme